MAATWTPELLQAYVDGALDEAERARVEALLAGDAQARAALARERALRARLDAAFAPVLDEPVPARLLAALGSRPPEGRDAAVNVFPPPAPPGARRRAAANGAWWAGLAAGLLAGVLLAQAWHVDPLLSADGGQWVARGALAQALSTRPSGTPGAGVLPTLSFRDREGAYCRGFRLPEPGLAGLACRAGSAWQVQLVVREAPAAAGVYRQAGSALAPAVLQAIDARIAGAALDAAAEAEALRRGWAP